MGGPVGLYTVEMNNAAATAQSSYVNFFGHVCFRGLNPCAVFPAVRQKTVTRENESICCKTPTNSNS